MQIESHSIHSLMNYTCMKFIHVVAYDWFFSSFIVLFKFLLLYRFPLCEKYYNLSILLLVDFWVVSSSWLLRGLEKLKKFSNEKKITICHLNELPRMSSGPFGVIWFYRHLYLCFDWIILQYCKLKKTDSNCLLSTEMQVNFVWKRYDWIPLYKKRRFQAVHFSFNSILTRFAPRKKFILVFLIAYIGSSDSPLNQL